MLDSDLIEIFPEYKTEIPLLLAQDNDFREVAEDYFFCKKELEQLLFTTKKDLIVQYSETLEDLKEELLSRLRHIEI
ncbi:MAG TPA: hypothetical protein VLA03_05235, partial [Draconibacterium sp.]|nr:hypothetical protein [Draconibacterium sp.]